MFYRSQNCCNAKSKEKIDSFGLCLLQRKTTEDGRGNDRTLKSEIIIDIWVRQNSFKALFLIAEKYRWCNDTFFRPEATRRNSHRDPAHHLPEIPDGDSEILITNPTFFSGENLRKTGKIVEECFKTLLRCQPH